MFLSRFIIREPLLILTCPRVRKTLVFYQGDNTRVDSPSDGSVVAAGDIAGVSWQPYLREAFFDYGQVGKE